MEKVGGHRAFQSLIECKDICRRELCLQCQFASLCDTDCPNFGGHGLRSGAHVAVEVQWKQLHSAPSSCGSVPNDHVRPRLDTSLLIFQLL